MVKRRHIRAWGDGYDGYILAKHDILWLFLDKQERICTWLEIYLWDHSSFKRKPQCGGGRSCTSLGAIKIAPETKGFSLFTGRYLAGHQNLLVSFDGGLHVEYAKPWTSNASEQSCRVESVTTGVHKAMWPATLTLIFLPELHSTQTGHHQAWPTASAQSDSTPST